MPPWIDGIFPFFKAYKYPTGTNLLSAFWIAFTILFALATGGWFWFRKCLLCAQRLGEMTGLLERFSQNDITQNYEQLRQQMTQNSDYGHLWQKFDEVIVRIPSNEGQISLFATLDAHYLFNESTLIAPFANLRFYNAVPGFLTGLGILGTFVGLTIGLAQIDLGSTEIDVLKKGIVGLLSGAAIAFSTSVWGMSLSIAFSIFEKHHLKLLHRKISDLQQAIDRLFVRRSPESWLAESLREDREQTSELKRL